MHNRLLFLTVLYSGFASLVCYRFISLSVFSNPLVEELKKRSELQAFTELKLTPKRGAIVDREKRSLAVTRVGKSVFINPQKIPDEEDDLILLAHNLNMEKKELKQLKQSDKGFVWIKRGMDPDEFAKLGKLNKWAHFVGVVDEPYRVYPQGNTLSHLVGVVGKENLGLSGLELLYNQNLADHSLSAAKVGRDARGKIRLTNTLSGLTTPAKEIEPLVLTIDLNIQVKAEQILKHYVAKANARGGSLIVVDTRNAEILAATSFPSFDPNKVSQGLREDPNHLRFRASADGLELGSVIKPFVVAAALEEKAIQTNDAFFCENGNLRVPGGSIKDDHPKGFLTVTEVVKYSSNICTYKIAKKLGREKLFQYFSKLGFLGSAGLGLPGEWKGNLSHFTQWKEMRFANLSFGQGMAISAFHLARAYTILAGDGEYRSLKILKTKPDGLAQPSNKIFSQNTLEEVRKMMREVVHASGGTGSKAQIEEIEVAGKTGTAEKYMSSTKSYSERTSIFSGILPVNRPEFAIVVIVDEPQVRPAYGGLLAAPAFAEIGSFTIKYLTSKSSDLAYKLRNVK